MRKNLLALGLCAAMLAGAAAGCGNNTNSNAGETGTPTAKGAVYYLNFKPEQADQWTACLLYTSLSSDRVVAVKVLDRPAASST